MELLTVLLTQLIKIVTSESEHSFKMALVFAFSIIIILAMFFYIIGIITKENNYINTKFKNLMSEERKLTYGEKAVGLTFNHAEGEIGQQVHEAKVTMAKAIDQMNDLRKAAPLGEYAALCTIAIRSLQAAQMQMVKAITWKD